MTKIEKGIDKPRRYLILKTPKISKKTQLVKQGHIIRLKMGPSDAAKKVAKSIYNDKGRVVNTVHLYRKGRVMSFSIKVIESSRKNGKVTFKSKLIESVSIKDKKRKETKQKDKKKKKKEEKKRKEKKEEKRKLKKKKKEEKRKLKKKKDKEIAKLERKLDRLRLKNV